MRPFLEASQLCPSMIIVTVNLVKTVLLDKSGKMNRCQDEVGLSLFLRSMVRQEFLGEIFQSFFTYSWPEKYWATLDIRRILCEIIENFMKFLCNDIDPRVINNLLKN